MELLLTNSSTTNLVLHNETMVDDMVTGGTPTAAESGDPPLPAVEGLPTGPCFYCDALQSARFHVAHVLFVLSFAAPNTRYGQVILHSGLLVGYLVLATWAFQIIGAPSLFGWYFVFVVINLTQLLYILYQLRPVTFDRDLDGIYTKMFEPFSISRLEFKRLISAESAQLVTLHPGECYAIENMTKTDRLGLLLSGKANVLTEKTFLHHVCPGEFLDSPEFESSTAAEDTFKVSICAAAQSRCIMWRRAALEYLLVKEPNLAQAVSALIASDIAEKLVGMSANLRWAKKDGSAPSSVVDLRLPAIAGKLSQMDNREHAIFRTNNYRL